jgi:hypothetical protein
MVLQLMQSASRHWRALNGSGLLSEVIKGTVSVDGIRTEDAAWWNPHSHLLTIPKPAMPDLVAVLKMDLLSKGLKADSILRGNVQMALEKNGPTAKEAVPFLRELALRPDLDLRIPAQVILKKIESGQ